MSFCKNVKFTQIFSLIFFSESEWVFSQNHVKLLFPREPQARNDPRRFRRMMNQVIDGSFQDKLGQLLTIMELSISELAWIFNILFSLGIVHLSWNDPQKLFDQNKNVTVFKSQGYPQKKNRRRLYGIYIVCFLIVISRNCCKLVSFFAQSFNMLLKDYIQPRRCKLSLGSSHYISFRSPLWVNL